MNSVIQLECVCKHFYTNKIKTTALNKVSLQVDKGEFIAITGKSGSGKSTLLNAIGLFSNIDSGSLHLNGFDVSAISQKKKLKYRREHLGYVFQSFNLIPDLSVLDNIMLPLKFRGVPHKDRLGLAEQELERMELIARKDHYPSQLSGGQQQRVAIARTMACKPSIILADEPTGNLDEKTGQRVLDILLEVNDTSASTIIMVTHSVAAASVAGRRVSMVDGELVN
ncbi:ABC transporter ATP-binding protein [Pseudoalteromonas sp. L23]|uniref:ABC transporter ATP-binding protein n=1 Tax=unclassified Pseudoalteromonas TaxID=194690 RepID=UPI001EEFA5A1|nr:MULTISPECIES: ABC transporter ATP-binding protein [unclassified Pseudoalteromonas]MCF7513281.1 ABC transporter ATP-binding protein [Pseudoalteromonas sp. L7]MCF7525321.1 ABC transporter ATP-binding protein [Pseudoalteromonas sp. L23]